MIQVPEDDIIIAHTKSWIRSVVVGCNFCPFAAKALEVGSIHYEVIRSGDMAICLEDMINECIRLDNDDSIETTLLLFPQTFLDFENYLNFIGLADELLVTQGYEGVYQLASFHPDYRFAGTPEDDPANYTNRSIYPMIHLLRESSIEKALANYPKPENIPENNIAFAQQKGLAYMKTLRDACLAER